MGEERFYEILNDTYLNDEERLYGILNDTYLNDEERLYEILNDMYLNDEERFYEILNDTYLNEGVRGLLDEFLFNRSSWSNYNLESYASGSNVVNVEGRDMRELMLTKVRTLKRKVEFEDNFSKYIYIGTIYLNGFEHEFASQIQNQSNKNKCFACVIKKRIAVVKVLDSRRLNLDGSCKVIIACDLSDEQGICSNDMLNDFIVLESELLAYFNDVFDKIKSIKNSYYCFSGYDSNIVELDMVDIFSNIVKSKVINYSFIESGKGRSFSIICMSSIMNDYNKFFLSQGLFYCLKDSMVLKECEDNVEKLTKELHDVNDKICSFVKKIEIIDGLHNLVGSDYSKYTKQILKLDLELKVKEYIDEAESKTNEIRLLNYYKELVQDDMNFVFNKYVLSKINAC